jgi:acetyl/propionyl-CoA carboxylase alpha subunit
VADAAAAERVAAVIGFPLILKSAAGGGGIGMMRVTGGAELASAFSTARRRAEAAFGDGALYIERYLEHPRHVEVQILGDGRGGIVHLHERECSIQRRHQKLIEESPAPGLAAAVKAGLAQAAVRGARAIGYVNAGTMEFLMDAAGSVYFLEMNTRLQVEHPVTEEVTGLDLVVAQLRVAAGEPLAWPQEQIVQRGAVIECRVYAEDPVRGFLPSPGTIQRLRLPDGEGIRVESGIIEGSVVSVHYDPLLVKVIARGESRAQAIERLAAALNACIVEGVQTTIPFLRRVLAHPDFRRGHVHTQMVEQGAFDA